MNRIFLVIGLAFLVFVGLSSSLFIVDQRQVAVIKTLGEIRSVITQPGLNFNWPMIQTVSVLDKRIQTLDSPESRAIFTAEKKSLIIDWLVKWRISDPRQSSATTASTSATSRTSSPPWCRRPSTRK